MFVGITPWLDAAARAWPGDDVRHERSFGRGLKRRAGGFGPGSAGACGVPGGRKRRRKKG
jgi:hypothetical protein